MIKTNFQLFLRFRVVIIFLIMFACSCIAQKKLGEYSDINSYEPASFQTERLKEWESLRYGMSICFGMSTFTLDEYDPGETPSSTYAPANLDVKQWISTAKKAGMKAACLTAKHVAGHCLWDSNDYDYDIATSSDKTDVVAEFMAACKDEGIKPCLYYCILDRHNEEDKTISCERPISDKYFTIVKQHLTELHTRYPGIYEQWIDIPTKLSSRQRYELYSLIKKLNPQCLVVMNQGYQNAVNVQDLSWPTDLANCEKNMPPASGHNPIKIIKGKKYYLPVEVCDTIGNRWYWSPDDPIKSAELLYQHYLACMQRNANFVLNVGVDKTGRIPQEYVDTLMKLKMFIDDPSLAPKIEIPISFKCFASSSNYRDNNFGQFSPFGAVDGDLQTNWASDDNQKDYWIIIDLGSESKFDKIIINESQNNIQKFHIQIKKAAKWKTIVSGTTIGNNWVSKFKPVKAQHIRLNILETKKGPFISEFQIFDTKKPKDK